jgi:hypothetical protein
VEPITPADSQRIVAAYLEMLEAHVEADVYPASIRDLPHPKQTIRHAFETSMKTLLATHQLTPELRDYLEIAYVSLADYVDDEVATLLREYAQAGQALAADHGIAREKVATDAWRRVAEQSRLAGHLARAISTEADELRSEFRAWQAVGC